MFDVVAMVASSGWTFIFSKSIVKLIFIFFLTVLSITNHCNHHKEIVTNDNSNRNVYSSGSSSFTGFEWKSAYDIKICPQTRSKLIHHNMNVFCVCFVFAFFFFKWKILLKKIYLGKPLKFTHNLFNNDWLSHRCPTDMEFNWKLTSQIFLIKSVD